MLLLQLTLLLQPIVALGLVRWVRMAPNVFLWINRGRPCTFLIVLAHGEGGARLYIIGANVLAAALLILARVLKGQRFMH